MASAERLLTSPLKWSIVATQVNGLAQAIKAAQQGYAHYITGISISGSGQPVSPATVLIKDGATILDQWEIPASAFAPLVYDLKRPYPGSSGNQVSVELGALGAGIRGTVSIRGFSSSE